ncbi:hypothetical protein BH09PSE2_BH09PSE2_01010 [soil metagenome]
MTDKEMMFLLAIVAVAAVIALMVLVWAGSRGWAELQRRRIERTKDDVWIK